jgi:hypothetical protein
MQIRSYAARLAAAILAAAMLAACGARAARGAELTIRYTTQQPTCTRAQLGMHARVIGDGSHVFQAVCVPNGPIDTWDAR